MNELIQKINFFYTAVTSWLGSIWDMFFSDTPGNVQVKKMMPDGTVETVEVPNHAKLKEDFETWKRQVEKNICYPLTQTGYSKDSTPITDFILDLNGIDPSLIDPSVNLDALRFSEEGDSLTVAQGETATFRIKLLAMFCRQSETDGLYDISFGGEAMVTCDGNGNVTVTQNKRESGRVAIMSETDPETGAHILKPYLWPGFTINGNPDIDAYIPKVSLGTVQVISRS